MIDWEQQQQSALAKALALANNASMLTQRPEYSSAVPQLNLAALITKLAQSRVQPQQMATGGGHGFHNFVQAISGQESGGNYGAVNPDSGAAGAYQIMPGNFVGQGGWDYDALGRDISLQRFLNSRHLQNVIAKEKLRSYFDKYGAAGAASAWYSGEPGLWNNRDSQGNYPSIHQYVEDILRRMGRR